ncbi:MAG: hypothetical protein M1822_003480 [Bathelium mastoideum]|nr:MAG: hypothetical protein M1822_003480 [Bathelium mastoideum]
MASSSTAPGAAEGHTVAPQLGEMTPSSPLEMTSFMTPPESNTPQEPSQPVPDPLAAPNTERPSQLSTHATNPIAPEQSHREPQARNQHPAPLNRQETEAIGPSSDNPATHHDTSTGPAVMITLLLTSGSRHPYKVDEKYLKRRNVVVNEVDHNGAMDPFAISVYTLKELIWRDWRDDWDPKPNDPSAIRLIHFGRMLDDKAPLKECKFVPDSANVVHMTVKPQELLDDEDGKTPKGSGTRHQHGEERTAGCRCVIL